MLFVPARRGRSRTCSQQAPPCSSSLPTTTESPSSTSSFTSSRLQPKLAVQISFFDLGQTRTRELSSRVVIGGSGVVPLCMCVYSTPGDEASERIIYGDSQARLLLLYVLEHKLAWHIVVNSPACT